MKRNTKKITCGTIAPANLEAASAREVLDQNGEILSCGGVYLGLNRMPAPKRDHFQFLNLTNHQSDIMVLNNQQVYQGSTESLSTDPSLAPQGSISAGETIRKLFKESMN